MGRFIDLDSPLSDEDKQYLRNRGRGYLIPANERRFGEDGKRKPEAHEAAGAPSQSPFYDTQERDRAVYDQGGAPLPGSVLDHNSGRVYDRENGTELVEPHFGTPQPGQYASQNPHEFFDSQDEEDSDIDEDIVDKVLGYKTVEDLKEQLRKKDQPVSGNKEELQNRLAVYLQDKRDGRSGGD